VNPVDLEFDASRLAAVCRKYGIARLDVFGSVSTGTANKASDIDLLYELAPDSRLGWDIESLADELAEILGRPVDLVSRRAIHERVRERILAEARPLYAA
jgi:hypothetical protein